MNVLITGISGFIGNALAEYHLSKGDNVFGIDKEFYWLKSRNQMRINLTDDFGDIITQISERPDFSKVIFNDKINLVYHCAAVVGVKNFGLNTAKDSYYKNLRIDRIFLSLLNLMPSAKVAFMSSSEVYGSGQDTPFTEEDTPKMLNTQRGLYSAEKYCMEQLLQLIQNRVYIFRLFNICGFGQKENQGFIPYLTAFLNRAFPADDYPPVTLYKDGARCYCHVSDAVRMMNDIIHKTVGGIFNIGNPALKLTNVEVYNAFMDYFNLKRDLLMPKIIGKDEIGTRIPNITKALMFTKPPKITSIQDIFADFKGKMKYF